MISNLIGPGGLATMPTAIVGGVVLLTLAWGASTGALAQEAPVVIPPPVHDATHEGASATAVFAGGCFWGVQGVFQHLAGVESAVAGYAGGTAATASYDQTSTGKTGHAEAVQVTYDPDVVSYGELLQVFFSVAHNPTELNYQGPDHGTQYRSALFPTSDEQAEVALAYIGQLDAAGAFEGPIVTTIEPGATFYPAEAYHQDYLTRHPDQPYVARNDLPKIDALKQLFPTEFRPTPVLLGAS